MKLACHSHSSSSADYISPTGNILALLISDSCGERLHSDGTRFSYWHTPTHILRALSLWGMMLYITQLPTLTLNSSLTSTLRPCFNPKQCLEIVEKWPHFANLSSLCKPYIPQNVINTNTHTHHHTLMSVLTLRLGNETRILTSNVCSADSWEIYFFLLLK